MSQKTQGKPEDLCSLSQLSAGWDSGVFLWQSKGPMWENKASGGIGSRVQLIACAKNNLSVVKNYRAMGGVNTGGSRNGFSGNPQ